MPVGPPGVFGEGLGYPYSELHAGTKRHGLENII